MATGNPGPVDRIEPIERAIRQKQWVSKRPPLEALKGVAERLADQGRAGEAATILVAVDRLRQERTEARETIQRLREGSDPVLETAAILREASVAFDLGDEKRNRVLHVAESLESLGRHWPEGSDHAD